MKLFVRAYGSGGRHLAAVVIALGSAAYGWARIAQGGPVLGVLIWFVGAIAAHDLILFPFYRLIYEAARRAERVRARRSRGPILAHLAIPAGASGLLLLIWLPLIAHPGKSAATYQAITGVSSAPFTTRWALISAGLFAVSALIYIARAMRLAFRDPDR